VSQQMYGIFGLLALHIRTRAIELLLVRHVTG